MGFTKQNLSRRFDLSGLKIATFASNTIKMHGREDFASRYVLLRSQYKDYMLRQIMKPNTKLNLK